MKAWVAGPAAGIIELRDRDVPHPAADEVRIRVLACGVCRTDLHVVDHELQPHRPDVVPGHQVVGDVVEVGSDVSSLALGQRIGIPWLRRTCGRCDWCRSGRENLCPSSLYTGWDADGGYAEFATVPEAFAYRLASDADPVATAPILCGGIIGYRALTRTNLPPGGRLGIYGYGSSAHLTAQLAAAAGAQISVMTRGEQNRELARELGSSFVGEEKAVPPAEHDAAIVFAPAGDLVPYALRSTRRGGTVVLAGIHMSEIPALDYASTLFDERDLRSVTANTRQDGLEFLRLVHNLGIVPRVTAYAFGDADRALDDLRSGRVSGSVALTMT